MMQPHERRSADAQRDCTAQSAEKAAHGDYLMSTTLTGAVFWIVERCVCFTGCFFQLFVFQFFMFNS